jgi:hypothetical protein
MSLIKNIFKGKHVLTKEEQIKIKKLEKEADDIELEFNSITIKTKEAKIKRGKLIEDYIEKVKQINNINFDRKRYAQIKLMQSVYYQGITLGAWK